MIDHYGLCVCVCVCVLVAVRGAEALIPFLSLKMKKLALRFLHAGYHGFVGQRVLLFSYVSHPFTLVPSFHSFELFACPSVSPLRVSVVFGSCARVSRGEQRALD